MAQRLRIGVVGCGTVAQIMHLPYLRSLPDEFELVALSDQSPGLLKAVGDAYGVGAARRYLDYSELVASEVDAVLIATSGSHARLVLDAVDSGKHVLVEKPLCFTLREADEIDAAMLRADVKLMVAYMKRYDPGFLHAQRLVHEMSDLRCVTVTTLHPSEDLYTTIEGVRRFDDVPSDVMRRSKAATDQLLDEAVGDVGDALRFVYFDVLLGSVIHDVNALRAALGEPGEVLYTDIWPAASTTPSITTVLRFRDDVRAMYTWSYLADLRDYVEEFAFLSPSTRIRVQFPSPFLKHWPTPVLVQRMETGGYVERRIEASYDEAFREELRAFHRSIVQDIPPVTSHADARADIAVLQDVLAQFDPAGLGGEAAARRPTLQRQDEPLGSRS